MQPRTINPILESRRQVYLDWLYTRANRSCGTYTGLLQHRQRELIQHDMDQALGPLGDWN